MSYIGDTPWKKFKKLCMLSSNIISNWGWKYYFYIVNLELRKQGFSIFVPDEKPRPLFLEDSFQKSYLKYIKNMKKNFTNDTLTNSDNISYQPHITIVMFFNLNDLNDVKKTIDSINKQKYNNWNLFLIPTSKIQKINSSTINEIIKDKARFFVFDYNKNSKKILEKILNSQGDFIAFLHAGIILYEFTLFQFIKQLNQEKNCEILYCDHDFINEKGIRNNPFFKPDWSPYILRSMDYISPFYMIKKTIIERISPESDLDNCFAFNVLLNCTEKTKNIIHLPLPLCSIKKTVLNHNVECFKTALSNHLKRIKVSAKIENGLLKNTFRVHYNLKEKPKVSIIIPTKNNYKILKRCIDSIEKKTNYKNKEIIIIDNPYEDAKLKHKIRLKNYYNSLPYKILTYSENFNFSKMNNIAVNSASGKLLLFLNDDTKVLDPFWLDELVSILLQEDVGAVSPKLIFLDNTIQHAGIAFLKTGSGFHPFMKQEESSEGYHNLLNIMRDCSAVTGACLLIKREIFERVGGFDNQFDVYYGDSDLCLKIIDAGFRIIYTPFTKLLHEGSYTISYSSASYFAVENHQDFIKKWPMLKQGDPYYNPNLDWDYGIQNDF